ncbi:hypothetical protein AOLI_G00169410 [Acnodon oligacanthus]
MCPENMLNLFKSDLRTFISFQIRYVSHITAAGTKPCISIFCHFSVFKFQFNLKKVCLPLGLHFMKNGLKEMTQNCLEKSLLPLTCTKSRVCFFPSPGKFPFCRSKVLF